MKLFEAKQTPQLNQYNYNRQGQREIWEITAFALRKLQLSPWKLAAEVGGITIPERI